MSGGAIQQPGTAPAPFGAVEGFAAVSPPEGTQSQFGEISRRAVSLPVKIGGG